MTTSTSALDLSDEDFLKQGANILQAAAAADAADSNQGKQNDDQGGDDAEAQRLAE